MYIGIAGNIGSGKSTLAAMLGESFGWQTQHEPTDDNPYLADFYCDMYRWAFNVQVFFLTRRFQAIQRTIWQPDIVVQDRTIYEDAYIFAENLHHLGLLQQRDYDCYMELFHTMESFIKPPALLIYLRATVPTLMKKIRQRNYSYEQAISSDYLRFLNQRYESWIEGYKGDNIIIDIDDTDFVNNKADRTRVLEIIKNAVIKP